MSHAAVLHKFSYFRQAELIINDQLLYSFNFVNDNKMLNRCSFNFREKVRDISIIKIEFLTDINGVIHFRKFIRIMNHFNNYRFYFLDKNAFLVLHEHET